MKNAMKEQIVASIQSEIGQLEAVILHSPGREVENMTPERVERALYSDILNLSVVSSEYSQFLGILKKETRVLEVSELLIDILADEATRKQLVEDICLHETVECIKSYLLALSPAELSRQIVEGVPIIKDNLSRFLSREKYSLQPLHNFFFTRDAAFIFNDKVIISHMASKVRERESIIMEYLFKKHPFFGIEPVNMGQLQLADRGLTVEGGDILVARHDILMVGIGKRTSTQGVDLIIELLKMEPERKHILVQELPREPESFIHLDMIFTFIDRHHCLIYAPVVLNPGTFRTVHIIVDNGRVTSISDEKNLLESSKKLGMDLIPITCGGKSDQWIQEREQWHSGANFFALSPGKVMGYGQNISTIDEMNKHGYEILKGTDILSGKKNLADYLNCVLTIDGSELSRGGGGCRCMTMPVRRKAVPV